MTCSSESAPSALSGTSSWPRSVRSAWSSREQWAHGPSRISSRTSPPGARTIARIAAGSGTEPAPPWPSHLTEDDEINAWAYEQNRDRPLSEVLAEADLSFERLAAAIAALPDADLTTPGRFAWMGGKALVDGDFFSHFHEEHQPSVRAWLASR